MAGYVYLIGTPVFGWYKIGKSVSPEIRIKDLGILLPFKIKVLSVWKAENHHLMEKTLHEIYKDKRINGEWFEFTKPEIYGVIESIPEEARIYLDNTDRFSNVEEDTRNNKKVIGVRTQKLRGDFTEGERNFIRAQYINHNRMHKSLEKVIGYSDTRKSFILICNKYQPHKDVKINIFRSILS